MKKSFKDNEHWEQFYGQNSLIHIPSQFAVFAANECRDFSTVIDIGCGNGRDSFFFHGIGKRVIGIDASQSAIDSCLRYQKSAFEDLTFLRLAISDNLIAKLDLNLERNLLKCGLMIYSRFFIHAITEEDEDCFITHCSSLLERYGGKLLLEFRTKRDELQPKTTASHYRRFIDPIQFFSKMKSKGFEADYFVEGFGLAKHMQDDAHVARFILTRGA